MSYESGNPELAANVVNQLINNYIDSNFQERIRFYPPGFAAEWKQQLQELKAKVEKSQQALVDYERQNLIVNVGDKETINDQRLEQLNKDYTSRGDRPSPEAISLRTCQGQ